MANKICNDSTESLGNDRIIYDFSLFYITSNYGTNENMRRRHRLKKFNDPVLNFNGFSSV